MVDGIEFPASLIGTSVEIELIEGDPLRAELRWAQGEQAGLRFEQPFNIERLQAPAARPRRAG